MADIATDLRTYLVSQATVLAQVSTRIYPSIAPQSAAMPLVIYAKTSALPSRNIATTDSCRWARIQYDVRAETRVAANAAVEALRAVFAALRSGTAGSSTVAECLIEDDPVDTEIGPSEGTDEWTYVSSFDVLVWYH